MTIIGGATAHAGEPSRTSDLTVMSRQAEGGRPSLVWASGADRAPAGASAEAAARYHLERLRRLYQAPRAAVAATRLLYVHDTGRGGIVVGLRPTVGGVDVIRGDIKVLMDREQRLQAVSGAPHPAALPATARAFSLSAPEAIAAAVRDVFLKDVPADRFVGAGQRAGSRSFALTGEVEGLRLHRPARVRPVYFPLQGRLVPAHRVELQAGWGRRFEARAVVVAADDGRVLAQHDLVQRDAYSYRVWADADGDQRPLDGPLEDFTPHPLGEPMGGPMGGVPMALVSMEGFNTNPDGVADPWLPPGATKTLGNNVDAYVNHSGGEGFGGADYRASVTAPGVFDRSYDLAQEPLANDEQGMASITQLFYTTNWLHDWWYDSGFDEAAGNAQTDNFGRGGAAGDPLLALAQESAFAGARDNAFMVTPEDGESPHMHMFLWSAVSSELSLTVQPSDQALEVGQAKFGPKIYDITADLVLVDDGAGESATDGCEPPVNDLAGKIVLIDRGTCEFELKANLAQAAGAVGVIFPDILPDKPAYPPGPNYDIEDPTIPGQGLSKADGDALKDQLLNGPLTAHMVGNSPPERDGTLENLIVAHEWGHYIHHRLVECVSKMCAAQGEGWGDFMALHLALRAGDDLDGTYADANYAGFDPTNYFGIRRVPYSVDFTKNALSFRHITDGEPLPDEHPLNDLFGAPNSEVHNAGEVWATMMWEVYVALHKAAAGRKSFDEVRRAMSDYIVTGMMMVPPGPTYTEQRDAILAAMAAQDPLDFAAAAAAFARRGAGTCAVSPARDSFSFDGVMEDFEVRPLGLVAAATVDDSQLSCDNDGAVDVGEQGQLTIAVSNRGGAELAGAVVTVSSSSASVEFAAETTIELAALAPLAQTELTLPFAVADGLSGVEHAMITITMTTPGGCETQTVRQLPLALNGDRTPASSSLDDVEAEATLWKPGGTAVAWAREANPSSGIGWHADDLAVNADTWLMSPVFEVSADQPLGISFDHAYYFESVTDGDTTLNWDGGAVEISSDGGKTWEDLGNYADLGYTGIIASSDNALSNRPGFVGVSAAYPALETTSADLGLQFAGQQIRVRFRSASDQANGGPGWDIDNIGLTGVETTPFPGWADDQGECGGETPTTSAGEPTSSSGEPDSSTSSTGSPDSATTSPQTSSDDGCGCRSGGAAGGWPAAPLLALLALLRRRRRG